MKYKFENITGIILVIMGIIYLFIDFQYAGIYGLLGLIFLKLYELEEKSNET